LFTGEKFIADVFDHIAYSTTYDCKQLLGVFLRELWPADTVEQDVYKALQLEQTSIDVIITQDARQIFVLTDHGEIIVYSASTGIEAKINAGRHVDQIKLGPGGIRSF
jgi:hypothetical protein